jgi:sugar lactone lactonase YvrE
VDFEVDPLFEVEGIAMSPNGNLYVGAAYEGEIYKVTPAGDVTIFADLVETPDDAYMLGLLVTADETVYAAVIGANVLSMNGVWRIDPDGEASLAMAIPSASPWASIPNALTFDKKGNLYVTDSATGSVWRLGADGGVELWIQHELLAPLSFFGANGISYRDESLWVLNTEAGSITQIPICCDGKPGKPHTFVQSDALVGLDGGQFDVAGNMYACNIWTNELFRVTRNGEFSVLISAEQFAPFYWPTNPVFGFGEDRSVLFISGADPSIVSVDVKIPGMLLPQFSR